MLKALKNFFLNNFICLTHPSVKIGGGVAIALRAFGRGQIKLGRGVHLLDYVRLAGRVSIGDYSYLNHFAQVYAGASQAVTIGKFCSLAPQVMIVASNDHHSDWLTTLPVGRIFSLASATNGGAPVTIGSDVWVGAGAIILPGATIGHGAIVGAGSVVTQGTTIPAYEVWAGSPAKKIKDRFPAELKRKLLALGWWDWPIKKIKANQDLFLQPVTSDLLAGRQ